MVKKGVMFFAKVEDAEREIIVRMMELRDRVTADLAREAFKFTTFEVDESVGSSGCDFSLERGERVRFTPLAHVEGFMVEAVAGVGGSRAMAS